MIYNNIFGEPFAVSKITMRSRTELVTHQLEGSEFEDESDFEDSEEDWRPAKGDQKTKKIKTVGRGRKSAGGSKNGSAKRGRKSVKKSKKSSDEDPSEDDGISEPEISPAKKSKKLANKPMNLDDSTTDYSNASGAPQPTETVVFKSEPNTSVFGSISQAVASPTPKPQPLQRKVVTPVKSFPDKCGFLNLFIFKGDLKDGIVNNSQVCLWRRDGSSLLQKYLRDKTVDSEIPQFNSSMVYSCWEDKRANEYVEVKVRCLEQSKQIRVELTDVDELEEKSKAEYENYVATYGAPVAWSGSAQQDDDDDDDCEEDDIMDGAAGEEDGGEGEEFDEDDETEEVAQEE